jgi:hypothetical protein
MHYLHKLQKYFYCYHWIIFYQVLGNKECYALQNNNHFYVQDRSLCTLQFPLILISSGCGVGLGGWGGSAVMLLYSTGVSVDF